MKKFVFGFCASLLFSIVLFFFLTQSAFAECTTKQYDAESGSYACAAGFNNPCDPPAADYCCENPSDCDTILTPTPVQGCVVLFVGSCGAPRPVSCQNPGFFSNLRCCVTEAECLDIGGTPVVTGPAPTIPVYDPGCTPGDTENVKTALGCLPTDPQEFINIATPWAIYLGGGIAFLLGIAGSAMIVLSAGNPEKMQAGKEMITSAIGGLILLIFAVFILKIIGVDILGLFNNPYQ